MLCTVPKGAELNLHACCRGIDDDISCDVTDGTVVIIVLFCSRDLPNQKVKPDAEARGAQLLGANEETSEYTGLGSFQKGYQSVATILTRHQR